MSKSKTYNYEMSVEENVARAKQKAAAQMATERAEQAKAEVMAQQAEDAAWMRIAFDMDETIVPIEDALKMMTSMRNNGVSIEQARTIFEKWKKKAQADKENKPEPKPIPRPAAYGSWA
jgi:hypothetical protein